MPRSRPGRVRTRNTNRRAPLLLSAMAPEDFNVRPGEVKSIACPGCRTWRRIMGDTVLKIREHCVSDRVAEGEKHVACSGSDQPVVIDIDVRRWQARQDRLLRDAMPQDNRRAAQQFYKPFRPRPRRFSVSRRRSRWSRPVSRTSRTVRGARGVSAAGIARTVVSSPAATSRSAARSPPAVKPVSRWGARNGASRGSWRRSGRLGVSGSGPGMVARRLRRRTTTAWVARRARSLRSGPARCR